MHLFLLITGASLEIAAMIVLFGFGGIRRKPDQPKGITQLGKIGLLLFILGGSCVVAASYLSMLQR